MGASFDKQHENMAFSKFRHLASSLDRDCSQLSSDLEKFQTSTENENRSCLLLREILADVRDLKSETLREFQQSRNKMQPQNEILAACKRVLESMREDLESLEDHLEKYGYKRPNDPLTSFQDKLKQIDELDTEMKDSSMAMETNRDETFVIQDQLEQKISSGDDVGKTSSEDEITLNQSQLGLRHSSVSKLANENDTEPMGSPVRPVTFTRMLQSVPTESPQASLSESAPTPPHAPMPPVTATPLLKQSTALHSSGDELTCKTENDSLLSGSPVQPVTATPMMKSRKKLSSTEDATPPALYSPLPHPPLLGTPGLKAFSVSSSQESSEQMESCDMENMPEAPDITSVQILKPDDFAVRQPNLPLEQEDTGDGLPFVVAPVSCEEYDTLPEFIRGQFTLQFINQLTETVSRFLSSSIKGSNESPTLKEKDLREVLQLGPLTKAYMLVLANLSRIKLKGDLMIFVS